MAGAGGISPKTKSLAAHSSFIGQYLHASAAAIIDDHQSRNSPKRHIDGFRTMFVIFNAPPSSIHDCSFRTRTGRCAEAYGSLQKGTEAYGRFSLGQPLYSLGS